MSVYSAGKAPAPLIRENSCPFVVRMGSALDKFGYTMDNFGAVWAQFWHTMAQFRHTKTTKNSVFSLISNFSQKNKKNSANLSTLTPASSAHQRTQKMPNEPNFSILRTAISSYSKSVYCSLMTVDWSKNEPKRTQFENPKPRIACFSTSPTAEGAFGGFTHEPVRLRPIIFLKGGLGEILSKNFSCLYVVCSLFVPAYHALILNWGLWVDLEGVF